MKVQHLDFEDYLDFEVINEPWSLYALEDDSVIKLKLVLVKVLPGFETGKRNYAINTTSVVGILTPKTLKKAPTIPSEGRYKVEKEDIPFKPIEEKWGEYKLEDGHILKIKPAVTSIDKTKDYDPHGEPIYIVKSQVLIKS